MPIIEAFPKAPTGVELARLFFGGMEQAQNRQQDDLRTLLAIATLKQNDNYRRDNLDQRASEAEDRRWYREQTLADKRDAAAEKETLRQGSTQAMLAELSRVAQEMPQNPDMVGPPAPGIDGRLGAGYQSAFEKAGPEAQRSMLQSVRGSVDDQVREVAKQQQEKKKAASIKFLMDELGGVDENGIPVSKAGKRFLADLKAEELGFSTGKMSMDELRALDNPGAAGAGMKPVDVLRQMRIATAELDQQIKQIDALRNPITRSFQPVTIGGQVYQPEQLQEMLIHLHQQKADLLGRLADTSLPPELLNAGGAAAGGGLPGAGMAAPLGGAPMATPVPTAGPTAPTGDYVSDSGMEIRRLLELKRQTLGSMMGPPKK